MEMENIIEIQLGRLLKKFGSGSHKPGSGSAVALQGMVAAQMVRTVIELTKEKPAYKNRVKDLEIIISEIDDKIYPALEELIQKDSVQFGKAIEARKARNAETDIELKSKHANEALNELREATEIPIAVAKYCIRLTQMGLYIFDNGFQSARGDSSVAINGALSAVSGCLSIINLNLLSFTCDEWTSQMRNEADLIKKTRDELSLAENERQEKLKEEAEHMHNFYLEVQEFQKGLQMNEGVTNAQIEQLVSNIQNAMWTYRDSIWKKNTPETHIEIANAEKLLRKLGYQYQENESLGSYEDAGIDLEIAGIIDTKDKHVSISTSFSPEIINFTVAHELGHAILHPNQVLHRDRPMDGSPSSAATDFKERQANKFAACFIMPRKLVINQVKNLFSTSKIELNTQTAIAFGMRLSDLRAMCKNVQDFARIIATAENYNARTFHSLADQFQVSPKTMAIRLEELGLVSI